VQATVLNENTRMLGMTQAMGFLTDDEQPEGDTVALTLLLAAPAKHEAG